MNVGPINPLSANHRRADAKLALLDQLYRLDRRILVKRAKEAVDGPLGLGVASNQVTAVAVAMSAAGVALDKEESEPLDGDITSTTA